MSKDLIKEILDKDELAGDIIRVLSLFNNVLWESEVRWEIEGMNSTLGKEVNISSIEDKLNMLSENGLIKLEKRIKGTMSGESKEEYLIKLSNPRLISQVLEGDSKLREYQRIRLETYRKFFEEK